MSTVFGHGANTSRWRELLKTAPDAEARGELEASGEPFNQGGERAAEAYGQGDRPQETRDGNLSSILAQIRDYGPALLSSAAEPAGPPEEPPVPLGPREPPAPPPESSQAELPPAPPGRSWSETMPKLPPDPAARARWRPALSMAGAVLAAILVTGGVIAVIYRAPLETGLRRERVPDGDPVLREEIAALHTSISKLADRVETIAVADKAPRQELVLGEPLDVSGWVQLNSRRTPRQDAAAGERPDPAGAPAADPARQRPGSDGLEVRLDTLERRLDSMAEKMLRLSSETERSLAQVLTALTALTSQGSQRMASPLAEANTAAARPVAADAVVGGAAAGNPPAAARPVGDAKAATPPPAPEPSAPARVPSTGANPHPGAVGGVASAEVPAKPVTPGAPVAAAEPVDGRPEPQVVEPADEGASPRPAPTLPPAEQKKWQRLAAILGEDVSIPAAAVTTPRGREGQEGQAVAPPEAAGTQAPLIASAPRGLAAPTGPEGRGAAPAAPPQSVVPAAAGPKAPPAVAGGDWFINLIAVRSKSTALELQRSYRAKGVDAQVVAFTRNGPFGVRVGGFNSRRDAVDRAPAIKAALGIRHVWIARR